MTRRMPTYEKRVLIYTRSSNMTISTKTIIYPSLDFLFSVFQRTRLKHYNISNTIVIAASGRGGSTWLAEIVSTLPGYPVLWEPLHPGKNPECLQHGFNYNTYISKETETLDHKSYVEQILAGTKLSTKVTSALAFEPSQYLQFRGFLVKFVNANLILYWLANQFPVKSILLIRHPCAVVASQLKHNAWNHVSKENLSFPKAISIRYPHLDNIFNSITTQEEALAFAWVLKTYVPLSEPKPHPWYLLTYEDLVANGELELERLFTYLGEPVPEKAYRFIRKPSSTTQDGSNVATGRSPLMGWKNSLTAKQISQILKVVKLSGVDFYNEKLMPEKKKINELCTRK